MCDHQNQASLINSFSAEGDVTITVNGDVHARAGDDGASTCSHNEGGTQFLQALNKIMWDRVNSNTGFLKTKLDFQVYPQIAESSKFYEGRHVVDITDPKYRKDKFDLRCKEYVKEMMFEFGCSQTPCQTHSFKSIMKEFSTVVDQADNDKLQVFGLFAQAGAGKTTCMRHWAKHTMIDNQIRLCSTTSENPRFSLVLYYDLKSLTYRNKFTLLDFLLDGIVNDNEKDVASEWLLNNDSKVIIFFDGLDQTTWMIGEEHEKDIGPHTQTDTPTIMYSILSRGSLSRARVMLSSREFKAATLPCCARPQRIFTLTGFSNKDARALFNAQVSKDFHEDPWEDISRTSSLQHFLTIPMFLTFAALIYVHSEGFIPDSVTELLVKVLEQLERCKNIQERKDIWTTISKLKGLAHQGMEKGLVMFTIDDLKDHNLSLTQVRDLLLMVPSSNIMNQCLLEGDFRLFFCHQTIQEILSACVIVELPLQQFNEFVWVQLHKYNWTTVCRFVCGLLFMKSPNKKFVQISDASKKQMAVCKSLLSELQNGVFYDRMLEIYASVHESNSDALIKSISNFDFGFIMIGQAAAHVIGSLINRKDRIDLLAFEVLHDDLLTIITSHVKNVIQINEIQLRPERLRVSTFNNFFRNIRADKVYIRQCFREIDERLDTRNISRVALLDIGVSSIYLTNYSDTIKVDTLSKLGCCITFNVKEETLSVNGGGKSDLIISVTLISSSYLKPKLISLVMKEAVSPQYIYIGDVIAVLSSWESPGVVNVDEIVLDATHYLKVNKLTEDCIAKIVQWLSVKTLHVAVAFDQCNEFFEMLKAKFDASSCKLKIWLCAKRRSIEELCGFFSEIHSDEVEQKRCYCKLVVGEPMGIEVDSFFIRGADRSKLWIAPNRDGLLNDSDKEILQKAARLSGLSLEFSQFDEWGEVWKRVLTFRGT